MEQAFGLFGLFAMIWSLCVVEVEVTVSNRPKKAVGFVRIMLPSSIACAMS